MELFCDMDDVCRVASYLLRFGGSFFVVHRPSRISDLFASLRKYSLEPKKIRFVQDTVSAEPSLILAEARKGGKSGVKAIPTLIVKNPDGSETDEIKKIYQRK